MLKQIRRGVFETNSSSVHSLTLCTSDEWDKWANGELTFARWGGGLVKAEVNNNVNDCNDDESEFQTMDDFFDNYEYETFTDRKTLPSGEVVVAFGYYGHD